MDLARATLVLIRVLRTLSNSIAKNLHKLKICLRFYFFTKNSTFRLIIFWAAFASFHSAKPGFAVFHSGTSPKAPLRNGLRPHFQSLPQENRRKHKSHRITYERAPKHCYNIVACRRKNNGSRNKNNHIAQER